MKALLSPLIVIVALVVAPFAHAQTPPAATPNLDLEYFASGNWQPGHVNATLRLPDGRLLVGGRFDRALGGIALGNLLRLDADGTIDAGFNPAFASSTALEINALAFDHGMIYVGGLFETVDGEPRVSLVRLDTNGALDTSWTAPFIGTSFSEVHAIAVTDNGVYVAGDLGEDDAFGLVRLDRATGARDAAWIAQLQYNPTSTPTAGNRGEANAIVAVGDDLLVGGEFGQIAGVEKNGLARISQSAPVAVRAFDAGISGTVHALLLAGANLYVGGTFFRASDSGPAYLDRVDASSGALDAFWSPTLHNGVLALDLIGRMLYVGGYFGEPVPGGYNLVRIATDGDGAADASWNPAAGDGEIRAIADDCRGHLAVGGDFLSMSGLDRNGYAAFAVPGFDCLFADGFDR